MVTAGRDVGKIGIVKEVVHDKARPLVVVDGLNLQRRPMPSNPNDPDDQSHVGRFLLAEKAMHYSNVSVIDPVTRLPCRVGWAFDDAGRRVRVTRGGGSSGSVLGSGRKPAPADAEPLKRAVSGTLDTTMEEARRATVAESNAEERRGSGGAREMAALLVQLDRFTSAYHGDGAPKGRGWGERPPRPPPKGEGPSSAEENDATEGTG